MAEPRKAKTMDVSGGVYAKVAERLKIFRSDWPKSKSETAYEYEVDGSIVFTVWLWKDKTDYIEVLKEVKDEKIARGSSDANGTAKGDPKGKKDFEKIESIALGRALAMLGYLASGEIASFEEMEEFLAFREKQHEQQITDAVKLIEKAKTNDELNKTIQSISHVLKFQPVIDAGKKKRAEFAKDIDVPSKSEPEAKKPELKKPVRKPVAPKKEQGSMPALNLEEPDDADSTS
jgi:hypothetical protein